jgi:hypothetical protein
MGRTVIYRPRRALGPRASQRKHEPHWTAIDMNTTQAHVGEDDDGIHRSSERRMRCQADLTACDPVGSGGVDRARPRWIERRAPTAIVDEARGYGIRRILEPEADEVPRHGSVGRVARHDDAQRARGAEALEGIAQGVDRARRRGGVAKMCPVD